MLFSRTKTPLPSAEQALPGRSSCAFAVPETEAYHQQYLAKNPDGYCGIGGTGVSCPVGLVRGDGAAAGD